MSFVTMEQFQLRYENSVAIADEARLQALLDDACDMAGDIIGDVYSEGDTIPGGVTSTICKAVRRALDNPDGFVGETNGDYSWRLGSAGGAGLYFTNDEKRTMLRAVGRSTVATLEMQGYIPDSVADSSQYVSDAGSSEPILYYAPEDTEQ